MYEASAEGVRVAEMPWRGNFLRDRGEYSSESLLEESQASAIGANMPFCTKKVAESAIFG